jgi:tRNA A37 threonylcarbamoyladenosine biosynthesis protein TsaE
MANKINSNEFVSMLNEDLEENLVIVEWGAKISKRKLSEYFEVKVKILADDSREYELVE